MVRCLSLLTALLLTLPLRAADEAKPNTLTPKEIADGWLLLFDGESTFGWLVQGSAKVVDGLFLLDGEKGASILTTTAFSDFEMRFEYRNTTKGKGKGLADAQLVLDDHTLHPRLNLVSDEWQQAALIVNRMNVNYTYEGVQQGQNRIKEHDKRPKGEDATTIGFTRPKKADGAQESFQLALRNIKLRPTGMQSLFNGKDLAGWKVFPGEKYKSKFTVTKEGWLNIKDGPGDIQTEGQWADFVLQLECISNGKHLNSGVFFRCRPNEYQQGYEAQVRNQFTPEPMQEYTIDEYDPKTNELKDKKKIKSTAFDFGTGAIYRRMPARKEVAKDGEWFTLTLVAQGKHLATWVNGIQVVDWTDNRPPKDNGRNGCYLEKGHISLQGHDPTTDLSFRNFRIAKLLP